MNPPQFFAEIKRPNVSVLLGAFATSGWLSLQAIAILWAAFEAMARGMKLLVRAMAPRKTQPRVILESTKEMSATLRQPFYIGEKLDKSAELSDVFSSAMISRG